MEYIGEHIWIGKLGNAFVLLAFVFALLASVSYFFATRENEDAASWRRIARIAFRVHGFAVFGIVVTLFFMLKNHYFEYEYVWHHSSKAMPMQYILSCFWEGQEGSFLLWTFWHVIIGFILQRSAKDWEPHVMMTISLVQTFLASMLLGIFLFEKRIGSNPFTVLLREHPDYANIPMFTNPDYLSKFDGRGLNPLLQNYWMTIHPPTLFLGFALTVVPFAYAIAGLMQKKYHEWIKPALPWTFFGVMILGTGILMGGAWAYVALSFGGFWAWDPVENASLVPWLTLVGTGHLMLINRTKGQSLFTTILMAIITFILILYSTYLTRSGVLGETSVHAFTDLGMTGQLLLYLLFFLFLGIYLLIIDKKYQLWYGIISVVALAFTVIMGHGAIMLAIWLVANVAFLTLSQLKFFPRQNEEEEGIWSREFWMFVGAIILLVSSFQIIFYTSLPVWNKLFDLNLAEAKERISFYNSWQVPFAFLVTLLVAVAQYFKYKNSEIKVFLKKIVVSFVISFLLAGFMMYILNYDQKVNALLMFSSIFAAVANLNYFVLVLKGKIKHAGASLAHVGFALTILGALISTSKKEFISQNTSSKDVESLGKDFSKNENIVLTQGDTLPMGDYFVTYTGKNKEGVNIHYSVDYFKKMNGRFEKEFTLTPLLQTNPMMGNVYEPATHHYPTFDVYTHVTYADLSNTQNSSSKDPNEYAAPKMNQMSKGDTAYSSAAFIIFDSLSGITDKAKYGLQENDLAVYANLRVITTDNKVYKMQPVYALKGNMVEPVPVELKELGLRFIFDKINPDTKKIEIAVQEKNANVKDFIVMQAIVFPYINILWIGCIMMAIGTLLAVWERVRRNS